MSKNNIIALLTDFGLQDVYVGVMKATIARIDRDLRTIDLTHDIPPQNVVAARFCLMDAHPYLPENTVCLAVVDPGVGSKRRAIAIELENGFLVGADNGLFSGILDRYPPVAAVELTNSQYWRSDRPSNTFHGRDIFAPVAAHLASGVPLLNLGKAIAADSLVRLDIPECEIIENNIFGSIQYIDRFGNLITNIPRNLILDRSYSIVIDRKTIFKSKTYSDVSLGEIVTLIGSHGWLEIAVNGGNAKERLQLDWGDRVSVNLRE
jgi:S-adenosyl-L-methionine hydrolase (adenosine-forming)